MLVMTNRRKHAVKNLSSVLTHNVIRRKYYDWSMEELSASIAKDDAVINDSIAQIETLVDDSNELSVDSDTAENIADIVDQKIDSGEGLSETNANLIEETIEAIYRRHGLSRPKSETISSEDFSTNDGRMKAAKKVKVSIEGFFDSIKKFFSWIWDKICGFFRKVKEFFTGKSEKTGEQVKKAEEGAKQLIDSGAVDANDKISPDTIADAVKKAEEKSGGESNNDSKEEDDDSIKSRDELLEELAKAKAIHLEEFEKVMEEGEAEVKKGYETFLALTDILRKNAFKKLPYDECRKLYEGIDKWLNKYADKDKDGQHHNYNGQGDVIAKLKKINRLGSDDQKDIMLAGAWGQIQKRLYIYTHGMFSSNAGEAKRGNISAYFNRFNEELEALQKVFDPKNIPKKPFYEDAKNWFKKKLTGKDDSNDKIFTLEKADFNRLAAGVMNLENVLREMTDLVWKVTNSLKEAENLIYSRYNKGTK